MTRISEDVYKAAHDKYMADTFLRLVDIADELGVAPSTVKRNWMRLKLPRKPQGWRPDRLAAMKAKPKEKRERTYKLLTDEQVDEAYDYYWSEPALTLRDVAKEYGCTHAALSTRFKKMGGKVKDANYSRRFTRDVKADVEVKPWEPVLDTAEVKPRRAGDKWACDVYIQGSRWRTFRHRYRGPALELGRRYVRALVAELTGDGYKGAEVATGD